MKTSLIRFESEIPPDADPYELAPPDIYSYYTFQEPDGSRHYVPAPGKLIGYTHPIPVDCVVAFAEWIEGIDPDDYTTHTPYSFYWLEQLAEAYEEQQT